MITRDKYNKALITIEEFHQQLYKKIKEIDNKGKTIVEDWVNENIIELSKCRNSTRLKNILNIAYKNIRNEYVEDIKTQDLIRYRNMGQKSIDIFVKLRGY